MLSHSLDKARAVCQLTKEVISYLIGSLKTFKSPQNNT